MRPKKKKKSHNGNMGMTVFGDRERMGGNEQDKFCITVLSE